ncbi:MULTISPECIES: hypothetical protein [Mammaliicoccus]|uniref:Uncharacterized protein n=1 Tax=Mammaliicoccus vitulinus TaxID=71237 RepID=A0A2T4PQC7_9STAP|nr:MULTISPECIES: hypothetical protein [Mammaliicoccus]HAL09476.1 hypothetical protein [Staphylococcus sp.]MBM6628428.1 hypothetical protein [Mammaliicoccus vitulinus]MBO3077452.1 hypothetical protein [Mammaliicoccus vitulinus]MEB7658075.1 hypothetical protein [Mammaliicoccus vitulinus]PNZ35093.1 hypothetical protein CD107_11700 [Mammaliicoccus vitulinus]
MNNEQYKAIVYKKLWFINKKEKNRAHEKLNSTDQELLYEKYGKPSKFVNHFVENEIIDKAAPPSSLYKIITLGGLLFGNVLMAGILITATLLILGTFTLYFTKSMSEALTLQLLYLVIGLVLLFIGYKGIKWINAYFTRRLLIARRFKDIT